MPSLLRHGTSVCIVSSEGPVTLVCRGRDQKFNLTCMVGECSTNELPPLFRIVQCRLQMFNVLEMLTSKILQCLQLQTHERSYVQGCCVERSSIYPPRSDIGYNRSLVYLACRKRLNGAILHMKPFFVIVLAVITQMTPIFFFNLIFL